MNREDLLKKMKDSVGTKDPLEFFGDLVSVFDILFDRIDQLEKTLQRVKTQSALSINWEPKVASDLLAKEVEVLRKDKDTYFNEIAALKKAFAEDKVTQNYQEFCVFWQDNLGWHPFLD